MCIVEQGCTHLIRPFVFTIHLLKCLHVMLSLEKVIHWKRPIDWLKVVAHWLYVCVCGRGGGEFVFNIQRCNYFIYLTLVYLVQKGINNNQNNTKNHLAIDFVTSWQANAFFQTLNFIVHPLFWIYFVE